MNENHRVHFRPTRRNSQRQDIDVDVHIIAGDKWNQKLFKVHKLILKERSDYFKVALSDQWVRKDPNGIIIFRKENISPEIFDLLLEYIYTGKVSVPLCDTDVDFVDLIGAADEILLPQLVISLEGYLVDMYLSESTKLLEVETWLQSNIVRLVSLKKDIPEGLSLIRSRFGKHVRITGHDSIQEITDNKNASSVESTIYVNTLLKVFNKYHFCREFINRNVPFFSSPSQLLVEFCDIFLRRNEKSSMVDNKDVINNIINIFKYLHDKDFFKKFYSQLLAERLLTQSSFSEEAELNMISRLENECGLEYTSKMRLLFHNIGLSKDLNNQFKKHLNTDDAEQVEFYILDMEALPMSPVVSNLIIPDEIEKTFQRFKKFYKDKYPSRRPKLLHHLSKGELKANYLKTPKVFQASTYQMSILLQYNNNTSYTREELLQNTGINQDLLDQQLKYLTDLKLLLLDKTTYDLNFEFNSEAFQITLKDPEEAMQFHFELQRRLVEERKFQIESTVFQIIRHNRGIGRNTLIFEVVKKLKHKFIPKPPVIKRAIDNLIEKEYIEYVDRGYRKVC
ncbi:Cullin-domain-containing protein [Rhizophagus irregularis]|uniref:Cullin-domain-containing protein n=1 Tax=Rhizophagus irregularis TaxID=588596 RepID=A0A2N1NP50_9GLOM|nr:Cullin-domain-containing protein [Rhizophagus irregularis]